MPKPKIMKNLLLILSFSLITISSLHAQILITLIFGEALNTENISFGLATGANVTTLTNIGDAKYQSEFNIGFYFDFKIADNFYIHPEVLVKNRVGARNISPYPTSDPDLDELFKDGKVERKISMISVPILAKYRTDNGWGVEGGPQFGLRTKAYDFFTTKVSDLEELELKVDIRDQLVRINAGVAFGLSKKLGRGIAGVTVLARYHMGFVDLYKDNEGDPIQTRGFIVNATVPIGAGKVPVAEEPNGKGGR